MRDFNARYIVIMKCKLNVIKSIQLDKEKTLPDLKQFSSSRCHEFS